MATDNCITISLTQGQSAIIDECDIDLKEIKWFASFKSTYSGDGKYVAANRNVKDGKKLCLYLHRVILSRILNRELTSQEICDPRDNAVRYVGATCQSLSKRLQSHMNEPAIKKRLWIDELKLQGLHPVIQPIEKTSSGERVAELEHAWILLFDAIGCKLLNHGYWHGWLGAETWHYK